MKLWVVALVAAAVLAVAAGVALAVVLTRRRAGAAAVAAVGPTYVAATPAAGRVIAKWQGILGALQKPSCRVLAIVWKRWRSTFRAAVQEVVSAGFCSEARRAKALDDMARELDGGLKSAPDGFVLAAEERTALVAAVSGLVAEVSTAVCRDGAMDADAAVALADSLITSFCP